MRDLGKLEELPETPQLSLLASIKKIPAFSDLQASTVECLRGGQLVEANEGDRLLEQGQPARYFWILLEGGVRVELTEADGTSHTLALHHGNQTFGEVPLLAGSLNRATCLISKPSRLLRLDEESFWLLMTTCPAVRRSILGNMALRMESLQALVLEREKLASLGTMAASLMHELNNPGTAARRASALLRDSLERLQQLGLSNLRAGFNAQEVDCLAALQQHILASRNPVALGSVEQADAEDALAQWLESHGISDAWKLAGPLIAAGIAREQLECVPQTFRPGILSGALNWVEAFVSSIQQLQTVEQSIGRVTDLVMAVKRYAYAGKICDRTFDLHESLQSTLIILGYKLRQKEIHVAREFAPNMPKVELRATGLGQVWTNLLDNAIDAAPQGGNIVVRTRVEGEDVLVGIRDDGPGVPDQFRDQLFEPFFTSKPPGAGTGLGLSIAFKIVTMNFGGTVEFESQPGRTEFIVRLPLLAARDADRPATDSKQDAVTRPDETTQLS